MNELGEYLILLSWAASKISHLMNMIQYIINENKIIQAISLNYKCVWP